MSVQPVRKIRVSTGHAAERAGSFKWLRRVRCISCLFRVGFHAPFRRWQSNPCWLGEFVLGLQIESDGTSIPLGLKTPAKAAAPNTPGPRCTVCPLCWVSARRTSRHVQSAPTIPMRSVSGFLGALPEVSESIGHQEGHQHNHGQDACRVWDAFHG